MEYPTKQCEGCQKILPISDFYQIKSSVESNVRWEKICKDCKRARRKHRAEQIPTLKGSENSATTVRIRDDGEIIYREYVYPNGEVLQITKEEFDRVVDLFRMLDEQDRKINGPPPLEEKEMFELPNRESDSNQRE